MPTAWLLKVPVWRKTWRNTPGSTLRAIWTLAPRAAPPQGFPSPHQGDSELAQLAPRSYRQSIFLDGPVERRCLDEGVFKLSLGTERWGDEEVITQTEFEAEGINGLCTFPVQFRHDDEQAEIRLNMPCSTGLGTKQADVPDTVLLHQKSFQLDHSGS